MQCGFWTARKSNTKFFNMNDKVYVSGGRIGTTLCMAPEDLKKVSRAEYADFIQ